MGDSNTKPWDWDKASSEFWATPSEDVFYYVHRWKELGLTRFLDLGCGIGRHTLLFAQNGFDATGYDLSENGLRNLSEKARFLNLPIKTVLGDFLDMDFSMDSFDSILAYHSLYHVDTPGMKKCIANISHILKSGGEIYFTMIAKTAWSYTAAECPRIDDNVRLKKEEDGSILPHFYVDFDDIISLFSNEYELLKVRYIEDIYIDLSGRGKHYFVHAKKR